MPMQKQRNRVSTAQKIKPVEQYPPMQYQQPPQQQYPQYPPQDLNNSRAHIEDQIELQRQQQVVRNRTPQKARTFWTQQVVNTSMELAQDYKVNALNAMVQQSGGRLANKDEDYLVEQRYTSI